jgi:hypothetical protein
MPQAGVPDEAPQGERVSCAQCVRARPLGLSGLLVLWRSIGVVKLGWDTPWPARLMREGQRTAPDN